MIDKHSTPRPGQATMHQLLSEACERRKSVASSIKSDSLANKSTLSTGKALQTSCGL